MPTVTNTLVDPSGMPLIGHKVSIDLIGTWSSDGAKETVQYSAWFGTTDSAGVWSASLPAQSSYEGPTYYRVNEPFGAAYTITVADTPSIQRLRDRLMVPVPPATLVGIHLDDLVDVSTSTVVPGQGLVFDSTGFWKPGTPLSATSQVLISGIAATNLSGHRVVTRQVDGLVNYADSHTVAHLNAPLWVTTGAVSTGATASCVAYGEIIEPTWSWSPGLLYLGFNGMITQVTPSAPTALFLAQVGYATGPQSAFFDRQPSISLV